MSELNSIVVPGKVFLVGAGPGDPELITVKGLKALGIADVIVYDRLAVPDLLDEVPEHAELIYVGKKPGKASASQQQINHVLLHKALEGKTVVRLKGGDPFIFGRGGEEAKFLTDHEIEFELVPGISSALAAPLFAGIPLTYRNVSRSFTVLTGHVQKNEEFQPDWQHLANQETLVVLMGVANLRLIAYQLIQNGKAPETPVAIIHKATYGDQKTVIGTLIDISEKAIKIASPSVIVIGEVVLMAEDIAWFSQTENLQKEPSQPPLKKVAAGQ